MPRSLKKSPFVAYHLLKKINKLNKAGKKDTITTWSRSSTILPSMVGFFRGSDQHTGPCATRRQQRPQMPVLSRIAPRSGPATTGQAPVRSPMGT